jgi:serine/threonine protein phosphatase 1
MSRTFVIGDIHGCYAALIELTQQINLQDDDLLISVGDIVDRGNQSKEVYQYFANRPNSIVLMGNHERKHQKKILSYAQEIVKVQFGDAYEAFLTWIDSLQYYYETQDAIIIHAFFEHDQPLQQQKQEVLCGSTAGSRYLEKKYPEQTYWRDYYTGTKSIIYGHHVVGDTPKIINNTYGIDTGACHGNYLTAIELPGFTIHQVKAKQDYWATEQKIWQIPVLKAKDWNNMQFTDIDKQCNRLAYITDTEVVAYLAELSAWKTALQNSLPAIKIAIEQLAVRLKETDPENFSVTVSQLPFKHYVFKSVANNLSMHDLHKGLNTPQKVMDTQQQLSM